MNTFRERTEKFWNWFILHEEELHNFLKDPKNYDSQGFMDMIGHTLENIFSKNMYFEFSKNNGFSFSTGGDHFLFYLLPYIIAKAPISLKYNWTFSPYKMGGISDTFGFKTETSVITIADIDILTGYDDKKNIFYIGFYNEEMSQMDDEKSLHMFLILLDSLLGENIVEMYIGPIESLKEKKGKMIKMKDLFSYIEKKLADTGREFFHNPADSYTGYELKPQEKTSLRSDLYMGTTCFFDLIGAFYNENPAIADSIASYGAKACFIYYNNLNEPPDIAINKRNEIIDKIETFVLGKKDSGNEIGIIMGTGLGEDNCYIDILLFDEEKFFENIRTTLKEYEFDFYFSEFKQNGEVIELSENNFIRNDNRFPGRFTS
ncbi:MAG: hypothetical protein LBT51_06210 [Fusobacteriaceae bacterium]|jgi:hypothetical protein|nr:hypothetical protein [Fusobacteriaceae bacterium]